jgi:hypothetical protein
MKDNILLKRRKHFLYLGAIPSVIFLVFVILSLSWVEEIHQSNLMQSHLNHSYRMFYGELYEEARTIKALSGQVTGIKGIQDAFQAKNRELLQKTTQPIFNKIREDYEITHCYFHSLDRTSFLRVHMPDFFGDVINRFTLKEAERTGTVSYGLELGPLGTLTLRVVVPWRVDGQLVGFLELGKRIDNVIHEMKKLLEVDLMLVVNKQYLDKEEWEKAEFGQGGLLNDWDHFPDVVVFGMTLPEVPPLLDKDLKDFSPSHDRHKDLLLEFDIDSRQHLAGFAPLLDASDKEIGDIIIIKDFTDLQAVGTRLISLLLTGYVLCLLLYMVFVFVYLHRLKRKLSFLLGESISSV